MCPNEICLVENAIYLMNQLIQWVKVEQEMQPITSMCHLLETFKEIMAVMYFLLDKVVNYNRLVFTYVLLLVYCEVSEEARD